MSRPRAPSPGGPARRRLGRSSSTTAVPRTRSPACSAFDDVDWPRRPARADRRRQRLRRRQRRADPRGGARTRIVVESGSNTGFAGGCNLGVAHATGEYVAFINNDARPDARLDLAPPSRRFEADAADRLRSPRKVLDWDGKLIDYVDGSLTWFGMGYKREVEQPDSAAYDTAKDVLFGTGAAMFVRAELFREVGGFDERFFMFYEDVDLGWRLNLLGYRVRYVPGLDRVPQAPRDDEEVRQLPRELPARAQRAAVDVQELRRRVARPGAARRDGARGAPVARPHRRRRDGARPAALARRRRRRHARDRRRWR